MASYIPISYLTLSDRGKHDGKQKKKTQKVSKVSHDS